MRIRAIDVYSPPFALRNNRKQGGAKSPGNSLGLYVIVGNRRPSQETAELSPPGLRPGLDRRRIPRDSGTYLEVPGVPRLVHHRLKPCLASLLARKPERTDEWRVRTARCRIGACHGTRPYPGDHVRFSAAVFLRQAHLWVQIPDFLPRPVADGAAVVAHVGGESRHPRPRILATDPVAVLRIHGHPPRPARRELEIAFVEEHRHGIEV